MVMATPPAIGREAISEPTNGPLRYTTTEAATTMVAVIAILSRSQTANIAIDATPQRHAGVRPAP